jgi:hypothetical protein
MVAPGIEVLAGADHDVEAAVVVQIGDGRARPEHLVGDVARPAGEVRPVVAEDPEDATGRQVDRRVVGGVADVHVGADDHLEPTVAVEVGERGARP